MFKHLRSGLLGASMLALSAGGALADFELNILHINDFHSRVEAINKYDSTCSAEEAGKNECFGGIARVKTAIDSRRAELKDANLLVLDAGDQFQGSLFYTTYKSAPIAEFMNGIGFDAMAIGNHEFDDGPEELARFIEALKFPLISGNVLA
ncbi:MAG: metallophosphoesterase, partial [Rhizobium sp.]|nr:metallophosphoesterase [Rhizobium sp.]